MECSSICLFLLSSLLVECLTEDYMFSENFENVFGHLNFSFGEKHHLSRTPWKHFVVRILNSEDIEATIWY